MSVLAGMLPLAPAGALSALPAAMFSQIFPIIYGGCFLLLLWQAFRTMARGFQAATTSPNQPSAGDRTGRLTIHPELLDAQGQLTQEDLLTVRFGNEPPPEA